MILKGQKTHMAVVPGTQVRSGLGTPEGQRPQKPVTLSAWPYAPPTVCLLPPECSVCGGTGVQRGCGPGEAGDQCPKAMHGARSR